MPNRINFKAELLLFIVILFGIIAIFTLFFTRKETIENPNLKILEELKKSQDKIDSLYIKINEIKIKADSIHTKIYHRKEVYLYVDTMIKQLPANEQLKLFNLNTNKDGI